MKKIINSPANYVTEMLGGLVAAHSSLALEGETGRMIRRASGPRKGKVGIVSGGGSGHLPLFTGYVGAGLLDACSIGEVFEGPTVGACVEAIRAANGGAGVLRLYGNYGGDRMNFDMAGEMVEDEGIETTTVLGRDDVASASPGETSKRRGVAGIILAFKAAGASADRGDDLKTVTATAQKAVDRTRTIGVALAPCAVPGSAGATFGLGNDEIEMGIGIHGEPGVWRDHIRPADALVDEMIQRLMEDRPLALGARVALLVNSLGATPLEELYIMYRRAHQRLTGEGIEIAVPLVGPFVTSMEMAGASLSLMELDADLEELLAAPCDCPFWKIGA